MPIKRPLILRKTVLDLHFLPLERPTAKTTRADRLAEPVRRRAHLFIADEDPVVLASELVGDRWVFLVD